MIEIEHMRFSYPGTGFSLAIEQLTVEQGETVCWRGASGSGKTTLLHLVAGIYAPGKGEIRVCGTELGSMHETDRREFRVKNLGLVFQDFALLDYLNVLDNILLPYRIHRAIKLDSSVKRRAVQLAEHVGLKHVLEHRPRHVSQGERQRVAVCRALLPNPRLILADEPTANLDSETTSQLLEVLDDYATTQNATLVIVSHDSDVFDRYGAAMDVSRFGEREC